MSWREDVIPNFAWRIEVAEGDQIPEGYGLAYYAPGRPVTIAMPIPLNVIVSFWRALHVWLVLPPTRFIEKGIEVAKRDAWREGYLAGRDAHWMREHLIGRDYRISNPYQPWGRA